MRKSDSLLPMSSVEMKTDRFTSYNHYAKAGLIFATTTATYFLAKATGVLPSWFWNSETSSGSEPDTALTVPESSSLVIEKIPSEGAVFLKQEKWMQEPGVFTSGVVEPSLTDFQEIDLPSPLLADSVTEDETRQSDIMTSDDYLPKGTELEDDIVIDTTLIKSSQRHLLQQTSGVTIVNPIPDRVIELNQPYEYPLNEVFSGDYTLLRATRTNGSPLPDWLRLEYALLGSYNTSAAQARDVILSGSTAFVADGDAGLHIVDVSTPSAPRLLGSYDTPGYANRVAVSGNTVFIADGPRGLQIVDVSIPSAPRLLGKLEAGLTDTTAVTVLGNTVFIVDSVRGLQIVDVTTPGAPLLLGSYGQPAQFRVSGVAVSGNRVFIMHPLDGLQIVDVTTLSAPFLLGSFGIGYDSYDVAVSGNTVFVAAGQLGLMIVDVTTPSTPSLLSLYTPPNDHLPSTAQSIAVSGSTVFVVFAVNQLSGLLIVMDMSTPSSPRLLGRYDAPTRAYGVAVSSSTVFIASFQAGLQIIDTRHGDLMGIPNSQGPLALTVSAGNITHILANASFILTVDRLPYLLQPGVSDQSVFPDSRLSLQLSSHLFVSGSFIRLSVQLQNGQKPDWLKLSLSSPTIVGTFYNTLHASGRRVAVSGGTAFVMGIGTLHIVDVSTPNAPRLLSSYEIPGAINVNGIAVSDNTVYVTNELKLHTLDVSTPSMPRLLSSYSTTSHTGRLAVSGKTVFLANGGAGLQIVDVSTPSAPYLLGSCDTPGYGFDVAVSGSLAFVADDIGLQIMDVSSLSAPRILGSYDTPGRAYGVAVLGNIVFVADEEAGLQIVDVSIPSVPRLLSSYNTPGLAYKVAVSGNTVFIADEQQGLQIVDVSIPSAPRLLASNTLGNAQDLTFSNSRGDLIFVADNSVGLQIIDVSQWQLMARPNITHVDNYAVQLIATDALGGQASANFTLRVEGPPRINGTIAQQYAKVGQAFNYFVPQKLITDPNFDTISFTARIQGSSSLPGWLNFNGVSAIFVGVPQEEDAGNFTMILSATDNIAGVLDTTFGLLVDHLPVVTQSIPAQVAGIDLLYNYTFPNNLFFEPDGYSMSYSAKQSNGLPLPSWLTFNSTSRQFKGQPNNTQAGSYSIAVIAKDGYQGQAKTDFVLVVENFPTVNQWLTAPLGGVGISFNWEISSNTFADLDNDPLTYLARQQDGSLLPNWLSFNPQTLIFSGTPQSTDVRTLPLQLSAQDLSGGRAQQNFNLTVVHFPQTKNPISTQLADVGQLYQYTVASNTFSQADNAVLLYSAQQSSGLALPDWLNFNSTSRQLAGRPNSTAHYDIGVVATNPWSAQASTNFSLVVEHFPKLGLPLSVPLAGVGLSLNWAISPNTFIDDDNDLLSYMAAQTGGSALPNWLTFNPRSLIFSGVPQATDVRTWNLQLSAQDPDGARIQNDFNLTVTHFPQAKGTIPKQLAGINQSYQYAIAADTFTQEDKAVLVYSVQQSSGLSVPDWLSFNSTSRQLKGTPNITALGDYALQLVATNAWGAQARIDFPLTVEHFPKPGQRLEVPLAGVEIPFNWVISPNTFLDDDNDLLSYSASQTEGSALPNWLTFNPRSLVFSGVPQSTDVRTWNLQLSAQDPDGARIQDDFNLTVTHFPEAKGTMPKQLADVDQDYEYSVPADTFSQADHAVLLYAVQPRSGLALPDWLSFNSTSRQLQGKPNVTALGNYELQLLAINSWGAQAKLDFSLMVEHFPVVNRWLQPPLAGVDTAFNWVIPSDTFKDLDGDLLTYTARQKDESLLPNWLTFNPRVLTFSGIPRSTDVATLPLTLRVADPSGGETQQSFNVTITHFPKVSQSIPLQLSNIDSSYRYTLPLDTFAAEDNAVLVYSAEQSSGSILPDWLRFNTTTRQLSGLPNSTVAGRYELAIIATNPVGAQAAANFSLIAEYFPEVLQAILPPLADINSAFSFMVPSNSFIDRDGDPLTYTAQRQNSGLLPNWLTFNPQTLSFSGVPLETDEGDLPLQIIATDPAGAFVTNHLTIQVIHFPVLAHPQPPMTIRAGQSFNFSLPRNTFEDIDQTGLSYSTKDPLPIWLSFDNRTLSFSGKTSGLESVPLTLVATDTRGASTSVSFQMVVRGDVPPTALSGSLSNQAATVGQVFSYFTPNPLFVDAHNNTLIYSASQQDGTFLPEWLHFDNQTLHFSGKPGHGDTNFYATRTVGVKVSAQSNEGQANTNFNIIVGGVSWGQLAITIGAPLASVVTTLLTLYGYRALLLNRCNRDKYTPLENKENKEDKENKKKYTITSGEPFECQLFEDRPEEGYDLYLISKFNIEQCKEIKGNAVILTDENTAYFIIEDKIVMRDEKPQAVENINRQKIESSDSIGPTEYTVSKKKKEKVIKESTLKGGHTQAKLADIRLIHASIPVKPTGCCQFFKSDTRPLPGGERLPNWMEYDEDKNILRSRGNVPEGIKYSQLIIQAEGEAGSDFGENYIQHSGC